MTWTKTKPTKPGWYWYHVDDFYHQIIDVFESEGKLRTGFLLDGDSYFIDECWDGQWAGPIAEPEESE